MPRLFPLVALLLLAGWLPATQHCALEAAGLLTTTCAEDCSDEARGQDGCATVEDGLYKPAGNLTKVGAPNFHLGARGLCLACIQEQILFLHARTPRIAVELPLDWVPVWQFARRAAPPPRAPSLFVA
ncbi:MAG: hypothetical protein EXS43_11985 [Opitutus sp.]|nr:hypothetical protein [Opitutus sp.]